MESAAAMAMAAVVMAAAFTAISAAGQKQQQEQQQWSQSPFIPCGNGVMMRPVHDCNFKLHALKLAHTQSWSEQT